MHRLLVCSSLQTKQWRKAQDWYKTGKSNECETYQLDQLAKIIQSPMETNTNTRLNLSTYEMRTFKPKVLVRAPDYFEWTEDFDALHNYHTGKMYINLKFVCDSGGAQTRTLREVYHFIRAQIEYTNINKETVFFANILDGDTSNKYMEKLRFALEYLDIEKLDQVFIGDMNTFVDWYVPADTCSDEQVTGSPAESN
jgi:hypothetical protein